jgi:hypothetical protein
MSDLSEMFEVLERCCLHEPQWRPGDVDREIAWIGDRENGSESSSIVIVQLKCTFPDKPFYGLLTQSEDYTGHGCQCDSMTAREPSLASLLTHLEDYEIRRILERD